MLSVIAARLNPCPSVRWLPSPFLYGQSCPCCWLENACMHRHFAQAQPAFAEPGLSYSSSNKINSTTSTHPLIWTGLLSAVPAGLFHTRDLVLTQSRKPTIFASAYGT